MNTRSWLEAQVASPVKKAMPVLSFPSVGLLGISVVDLISHSEKQAEGMVRIAERCDTAASVSMMDLSLEADCFGSNTVSYTHLDVYKRQPRYSKGSLITGTQSSQRTSRQ